MNASDNRFYREKGAAVSTERDLAVAIHNEIISRAAKALDLWQHRRVGPNDLADMRIVLATISEDAIEAVLARRLSEAARTGPWDAAPHGALREQIARAIYDAARVVREPAWADAPAATRVDCYFCADAAISALAEPAKADSRPGPQEEDGYPGSRVPRKRGAP